MGEEVAKATGSTDKRRDEAHVGAAGFRQDQCP